MRYTYHSTYRGYRIERITHSGYYVVFILGVGQFMADTLAGIREMIRDKGN